MPLAALGHAFAAPMFCGLKTAGRGDTTAAPYVCADGHAIDPHETRQCPKCGVHDTKLLSDVEGRQEFRCAQCGESFVHPREVDSPS
jgi:hypothetical protein